MFPLCCKAYDVPAACSAAHPIGIWAERNHKLSWLLERNVTVAIERSGFLLSSMKITNRRHVAICLNVKVRFLSATVAGAKRQREQAGSEQEERT